MIISKAQTGLTIIDSAPTIAESTVTGCSQAGLYLKDGARPNITNSIFSANEGQGGIVIEGEGLSPVIYDNIFRNNNPFHVQSYAPVEIDLTNNYWGRQEPEADLFIGNIIWKPALSAPPKCSQLKTE